MRRRRGQWAATQGRPYDAMLAAQRRTIAALCGRLDLVQRDAEQALCALTEVEGRLADLEARVFAGGREGIATGGGREGRLYTAMIGMWAPPTPDARIIVGPARGEVAAIESIANRESDGTQAGH